MTTTPDATLDIPRERLAAFCEKWKITELSLFGSVVRGDAHAFSDIDLLYRIDADARLDTFDLLTAARELSAMLGRRVDLVSHEAAEADHNAWRREAVLGGHRRLYPV